MAYYLLLDEKLCSLIVTLGSLVFYTCSLYGISVSYLHIRTGDGKHSGSRRYLHALADVRSIRYPATDGSHHSSLVARCRYYLATGVYDSMNCNHCRANVEKVISACGGVEQVIVDLQSGRTTIIGHGIDLHEVTNAVRAIGFDVTSTNASIQQS